MTQMRLARFTVSINALWGPLGTASLALAGLGLVSTIIVVTLDWVSPPGDAVRRVILLAVVTFAVVGFGHWRRKRANAVLSQFLRERRRCRNCGRQVQVPGECLCHAPTT